MMVSRNALSIFNTLEASIKLVNKSQMIDISIVVATDIPECLLSPYLKSFSGEVEGTTTK